MSKQVSIFQPKFNNTNVYFSNAKNQKGKKNVYKLDYDDHGNQNLVVSGQEDVYLKIQENSKGIDLYSILSKFAINGDVSIFDKNKGFFADITNMPKSIHEFKNKINESDNIYNGLPIELKAIFNNNKNTFVNSIYDGSFQKIYDNYVLDKKAKNLRLHNEEKARFNELNAQNLAVDNNVVKEVKDVK